MQVNVVPYLDSHVELVREFNERIRARRPDLKFPESPVPAWLPAIDGRDIYQEYFLGLGPDGAVRGGYFLKSQQFFVKGRKMCVGVFQYMISEGVVNTAYSMIGILLMRDALKRQPFLYALGMGGLHEPLPRMLRAMRWKLSLVPFYFKVRNPRKFFKNVVPLRKTSGRRLLSDILAASGAGSLLLTSVQGVAGFRARHRARIRHQAIPSFDSWADRLWAGSCHAYSFTAVRDSATLNILYPASKPFHRLLVLVDEEPVGWAVLLATSMAGHKYFGDLRVGSIVDCMAKPGYERFVILASSAYLDEQKVDLIVSNMNHAAWCDGMRYAGFLQGPSNYAFGVSPATEEFLAPLEDSISTVHVTRADGDGPINL